MGIAVVWDNADRTIIRFDFEGRCTWDDFYTAMKQSKDLLRSVDQRVDFIYDLLKGDIRLIASNPSYAERLLVDRTPNCGITVMVGADRLTRAMYQVFCRVFPDPARQYKVVFHDSLESARGVIAEQRPGNCSC